jgi:hypothetical protein
MSNRYAADTNVPSDRSRAEIERILARYGAQQFAYGWDPTRAMIGFVARDRQIKFILPLPDREDWSITHTPARRQRRTPAQAEAAYEQAVRQRWRALTLVIKAKLEAVEAGITTFEDEFLAHTVLPDGRTAGEWITPQIAEAYATGQMPAPLLALPPSGDDHG